MLRYPWFAKCIMFFHSDVFRDMFLLVPKEFSYLANSYHLLGLALLTPTLEVPVDPPKGGKSHISSSIPSEDISSQSIFMHLSPQDSKLLEGKDNAFLIVLGVLELHTITELIFNKLSMNAWIRIFVSKY